MNAAEDAAHSLDRVFRLDTNSALPEAARLYRKTGWTEIPCFNDDPYPDLFLRRRFDRGQACELRQVSRADPDRLRNRRREATHVSGEACSADLALRDVKLRAGMFSRPERFFADEAEFPWPPMHGEDQ
jgi:hypothetical protein